MTPTELREVKNLVAVVVNHSGQCRGFAVPLDAIAEWSRIGVKAEQEAAHMESVAAAEAAKKKEETNA